jgi:pimeloyl-ACP methyl ester carboxylesterase
MKKSAQQNLRKQAQTLILGSIGVLSAALGLAFPAQAKELIGDGGVSSFYTWSQEISGKPGLLLRQEPLAANQTLENANSHTRILYTSTDGLDGTSPIVVSGMLFTPKGDPPKGGWPLVAWAHGTVGVADICAPSWTPHSQRNSTYLNFWLSQGYAVVASDYQGLGTAGGHPYLATRPAAFSTLDAIRAVQKGSFGLSEKVVIIGQSQGGGAAFATAGYASVYAPELDVRGTVATGTPYFSPEAQVALQAARPQDVVDPLLAYNFLAMSLLEQISPDFKLDDYVSDTALPVARSITTSCFPAIAMSVIANKLTFSTAYKSDPAATLKDAYALMGYPTLAVKTPIFMGTGAADRDVPPQMQLQLGNDACAAGAVIEAHLYEGLDHSGAVNGSTADSSVFVRAAFSGEKIAGNCDALPKLATKPAS